MQSEQIDQLAAALAIAQLAMKNPVFDQVNPAFKSKFASLAAVRNAVIPVLAAEGISVIQSLTTDEVGVGCETILLHKSGQMMRFGPLVVPIGKRDAWSIASAATYAKRISLQAVAVVVGDADDDGAGAQQAYTGHIKASPRDDMGTEDVDTEIAEQYAVAMIAALDFPAKALELHRELIGDQAMYVVASDIAQRNRKGFRSAWRALVSKKEGAA